MKALSTPSTNGIRGISAAPSKKKPSSRPGGDEVYDIILREPGGAMLAAKAVDKVLYPRALAWNRLLSSGQWRHLDTEQEIASWRSHGRRSLYELAEAGLVPTGAVDRFIAAAAASGVIQVEIPWEHEAKGWAARIFPWEQLLALATKEERIKSGVATFSVVRVLSGLEPTTRNRAGTLFAVTAAAEKLGYDYAAECAAIRDVLGESLRLEHLPSLEGLAGATSATVPQHLHLVLDFFEGDDNHAAAPDNDPKDRKAHLIAEKVAAVAPELAVFSSCHTGRRLAPMTVASGVKFAIGFHGMVMDTSLPGFYSAFYRALQAGQDMLSAFRSGLASNALQKRPEDLGCVTLWSAVSLLEHYKEMPMLAGRPSIELLRDHEKPIPAAALEASLLVTCVMEEALNYSVLHNNRGGLFRSFTVCKTRAGQIDPLEVSVRLVTGVDLPAECRFYAKLLPEANQPSLDLAPNIILPLGAQTLRQRGESILGAVEVTIRCGTVQIFHKVQGVKLLPCDEWRDDETGRHLLPSFVFPRDPSVREIISASQPFLRGLRDHPQAGFDGYQDGSPRTILLQARAIWCALQQTFRLDYINPPPSYTRSSQRLRTPEEILRSRRGTCIELALMLASCWEHIGIYPVIFLTRGHAFAGFWTGMEARQQFIAGLDKLMKLARLDEPAKTTEHQARAPVMGSLLQRVLDTRLPEPTTSTNRVALENARPWMFAEAYLLAAIREAVADGELVTLETTYIPLQKPFSEAMRDSGELLDRVPADYFEGMLDVQTAREKGVTPMSIIFQGVVA